MGPGPALESMPLGLAELLAESSALSPLNIFKQALTRRLGIELGPSLATLPCVACLLLVYACVLCVLRCGYC